VRVGPSLLRVTFVVREQVRAASAGKLGRRELRCPPLSLRLQRGATTGIPVGGGRWQPCPSWTSSQECLSLNPRPRSPLWSNPHYRAAGSGQCRRRLLGRSVLQRGGGGHLSSTGKRERATSSRGSCRAAALELAAVRGTHGWRRVEECGGAKAQFFLKGTETVLNDLPMQGPSMSFFTHRYPRSNMDCLSGLPCKQKW
jgi:hypothetical protein